MQRKIGGSRFTLKTLKSDLVSNILTNNLLIIKKQRILQIQEVLQNVVNKFG